MFPHSPYQLKCLMLSMVKHLGNLSKLFFKNDLRYPLLGAGENPAICNTNNTERIGNDQQYNKERCLS